MKKSLLLSLLIICHSLAQAAPFNKIVFFGDSISDNGNLYKLSLDIFPKSPPYFQGRFSNGPTWSDHLADDLSIQYNITSKNYAVGGATAIFHQPSIQFIAPTTLELELSQYTLSSMLESKSKTLFVIWIGGNDYLFDRQDDPNELTTDVVNRISLVMDQLIFMGAKYFLIANLPDLSSSPFAIENNLTQQLKTLSQLHNQKLAAEIQRKRRETPDINIVYLDVAALQTDMREHTDRYNQRYNTHFTNLTDSCWSGGFLYKHTKQDLEYIPAITQAYWVQNLFDHGVKPCPHPEEYVFWDQMHPTAEAHRVLALVAEEKLVENLLP